MTPESFSPLIEILRGGHVESIHGAAAVVVDYHGNRMAHLGDPELSVYWRSAAKPFQAWPLIQSGAADSFSLSEREMALACASHGGEPRHVEVAAAMLARGGYSVDHLQCGPHPPMNEAAAQALLRAGETPTSLHNNCSGKHAGMLLLGNHLQADPGTYLESHGPVQTAIRAAMSRITGVREAAIATAVDGCSAPTFRLSLHSLALAYARLGASLSNGDGDPSLARLARAMTSHPGMVAGEGRLDTALMEALPGALIAKLGAEGIYAVGLAGGQQPLGLAVKIADGDADRARTALILSLLDWLGVLPSTARDVLKAQFPGEIYNHRGIQVGTVKVNLADYLLTGGK